jgi:hypothetical protein
MSASGPGLPASTRSSSQSIALPVAVIAPPMSQRPGSGAGAAQIPGTWTAWSQ